MADKVGPHRTRVSALPFHKYTDMISDDDSFLSAYMDGQLDPDQHQWVESALVSNPQLAEQLRGLTVLRDLVAGLARDASVDVTPQVMEQIRARRALYGRRTGDSRRSTHGRPVECGVSRPPASSRPPLA